MHRRVGQFGGFVLATLIIGVGLALAASPVFLSSTNLARNNNGAQSLALNPKLTQAAEAKLADMQAKHYWSHISPDGRQPWDFMTSAGYKWVASAENLAEGYYDPEAVVAAWMDSLGHRTNMLNRSYREVGFAYGDVILNGSSTPVSVAMYGSTVVGQTSAYSLSGSVTAPKAAVPVAAPSAPTQSSRPTVGVEAGAKSLRSNLAPELALPELPAPKVLANLRATGPLPLINNLLIIGIAAAVLVFTLMVGAINKHK